jgi:hypothetical protein
MVRVTHRLAFPILAIALAIGIAACNVGNTSLSTTGLSNVPGQLSFRAVGAIGTPFTAVISDSRSSWKLKGTVPTTFAIVNGQPPTRLIATKTVSNKNLLSLEVINGFYVTALDSTTQPYGIVQVQFGGTVSTFAPRAAPDVRFGLRAPVIALVTGNIEDIHSSFTVEQRVPTIFLLGAPQGRVDGIFNLDNLKTGSMTVDLQYTQGPNPTMLCTATSDSGQIILKFPGCTAIQVPGETTPVEDPDLLSDPDQLPAQMDQDSSG